MKKIIFLLIVLLSLSSLVVAGNETKIDYDDPASIASAPASEIDVVQAINNGYGTSITIDQWLFGNNLEKATNSEKKTSISSFPGARDAIVQEHGLSLANFDLGSVSYKKPGILTNGDISINIQSKDFSNAEIFSLADGGFAIGKGKSQGKFTLDNGNTFDLTKSNPKEPVEIRNDGSFFLPAGVVATITAIGNSRVDIFSISGTEFSANKNYLSLEGHYQYHIIGDEGLIAVGVGKGKVEYDCDGSKCNVKEFQNNLFSAKDGGKAETEDSSLDTEGNLVVADLEALKDPEMLKAISADSSVPTPVLIPWLTSSKFGNAVYMLGTDKSVILHQDVSDQNNLKLVPYRNLGEGRFGAGLEFGFRPGILDNGLMIFSIAPVLDVKDKRGRMSLDNSRFDLEASMGIFEGPRSYTMTQSSQRTGFDFAHNAGPLSVGANVFLESDFNQLAKGNSFLNNAGIGGFLRLVPQSKPN